MRIKFPLQRSVDPGRSILHEAMVAAQSAHYLGDVIYLLPSRGIKKVASVRTTFPVDSTPRRLLPVRAWTFPVLFRQLKRSFFIFN